MKGTSRFGNLRQMQEKRDEEVGESEGEVLSPAPMTPEPSPAGDEVPRRGRPPTGRRSNPEYEGVMGYIPKRLHKQVKRHMLEADIRDFSEVLEQALGAWLEGQPPL